VRLEVSSVACSTNSDNVTGGIGDDEALQLEPLDVGKVRTPRTQTINMDGKQFHQCVEIILCTSLILQIMFLSYM
jgi:hypothetical protein